MQRRFKLSCLQYVFALAWADGHFDPVEREFLAGLLDRAGLDDASYMEAVAWLERAPQEPDWALLQSQPNVAQDVLRQAMLLAMLDLSVSLEEMAFLEELRDRIGLSEADFWRLQQEVEQIIKSQIASN